MQGPRHRGGGKAPIVQVQAPDAHAKLVVRKPAPLQLTEEPRSPPIDCRLNPLGKPDGLNRPRQQGGHEKHSGPREAEAAGPQRGCRGTDGLWL